MNEQEVKALLIFVTNEARKHPKPSDNDYSAGKITGKAYMAGTIERYIRTTFIKE